MHGHAEKMTGFRKMIESVVRQHRRYEDDPSCVVCECGELFTVDAHEGHLAAAIVKSLWWLPSPTDESEVRRLRAALQAKAEDYEHVVNENGDLRRDNARLQGQVEALRENVPAEYEVRCPDCGALVATEHGEN